ncbi:hypothetical protein ACFOW1_09495 [Parasediminibacterium paludis]|uniref:Uncharacterized protein n=1 Tax=Parasediminibacterium paludis TaxID=908966 RepID=A0ABV8PYS0_9BACT
MKKALIIIAIVLIPIAIYIGIILYVSYQLNNVPKPLNQAIKDIKSPSFTIDLFNDNTILPTIKTKAQADEEATVISPSDVYNSGYTDPFDFNME